VIIAAAFGRDLLALLYTPEYSQHSGVFVWVMVMGGAGYIATLLGAPVTAMQRFSIQLLLHSLKAALLFGLCLILVGRHGFLGATGAMLAGYVLLAAGYGMVVIQAIGRAGRRVPARVDRA